MPNDAKLGLLAGVLGVIVAAVISGKPLQQTVQHSPGDIQKQSSPSSKGAAKPTAAMPAENSKPTPARLPGEMATTPIGSAKGDAPATTTARRQLQDGEED